MIKNFLCFLSVLFFAGNVHAGPASAKLSALSDTLIKGYAAKTGGAKVTLAVFQFNCDEKLHKQRVGVAISEMMSHKFVADPAFTVVERGDINKLLGEQKLQASGAVDSDTAVRLGKILGAGVVLLGNVQKVDGKYQVSARLVNAETSEILVSGYEELRIDAFGDEAGAYLNLVPEKQALGIYVLYNYRHNTGLPVQTVSGIGGAVTVTPSDFNLALAGGGLRYMPWPGLMLDFSAMGTGSRAEAGSSWYSIGNFSDSYSVAVMAYRGLLSLQRNFLDNLDYYIGAGVTAYSVYGGGKVSYTTPTLNARIEYRPQSRVGISMSCGYDLTSKYAIGREDGVSDSTLTHRAKLNKFYLEPTVSVYF